MSKKIFMLLFLMFALISVSAVSAADLNDNDTFVSSSDAEMLSATDVDAIDELSENVTSGNDMAIVDDADCVASGKNNDGVANENSSFQLLATSDDNVIENDGGILKETSVALYVNASAPSGGNGSETNPFNSLNEALTTAQDDDIIMIASGEY